MMGLALAIIIDLLFVICLNPNLASTAIVVAVCVFLEFGGVIAVTLSRDRTLMLYACMDS